MIFALNTPALLCSAMLCYLLNDLQNSEGRNCTGTLVVLCDCWCTGEIFMRQKDFYFWTFSTCQLQLENL